MNRQDAKSAKIAKRPEPDSELDQLAKVVVDAAIEVHRYLGPGYLESVYEDALAVELGLRRQPFQRQVLVRVSYKGVMVGEHRLDLLVGGGLVVELKAVENLLPIHKAQTISYLRATRHSLALLINFNVQLLRDGIHRVVMSS